MKWIRIRITVWNGGDLSFVLISIIQILYNRLDIIILTSRMSITDINNCIVDIRVINVNSAFHTVGRPLKYIARPHASSHPPPRAPARSSAGGWSRAIGPTTLSSSTEFQVAARRRFCFRWGAAAVRCTSQCILSCRSASFCRALAVLMASAVVVLKHETSTHRQRHHFMTIDFKFSVGDNVREVTSPAKFGSDPIGGRHDTWAQHILVLGLF